jgi:hypothetical protein
MNVAPSQTLIEKHILGLRFNMANQGKKNAVVLLEPKISELET